MSRKSKYSIEQRVQACEDYHNGTRSLEEICIALGTTRKKTIREWLKNMRSTEYLLFRKSHITKVIQKNLKFK